MAIATTLFEKYVIYGEKGERLSYNVLHVTGLTANAQNTIPLTDSSGNPIIKNALGKAETPKEVYPIGWSTDASYRAAPSLDGSTAAAGYDANNAYVITPAGVTTCKLRLIG